MTGHGSTRANQTTQKFGPTSHARQWPMTNNIYIISAVIEQILVNIEVDLPLRVPLLYLLFPVRYMSGTSISRGESPTSSIIRIPSLGPLEIRLLQKPGGGISRRTLTNEWQ